MRCVWFEFGMSFVHAYFTLLPLYPVVPDFRRLLPVNLWPQKRRLNVDHRFLTGPRCVPGVTRQTAGELEDFLKSWGLSWRDGSYFGEIGLQTRYSRLLQQPSVKGFTPPWNLPVTYGIVKNTCHFFILYLNKSSVRDIFISNDNTVHVEVWVKLTCSLVVRPLDTRYRWKPVRPRTGIRNNPDILITTKLCILLRKISPN